MTTRSTMRAAAAAAVLLAAALGACGKDGDPGPARPEPSGCPSDLTACGDTCVDAAVDPGHCGSCGNACGDGEVCLTGQCTVRCGPGTTLCGDACVATELDPAHCGSCDSACAAGEVCSAGSCGLECVGGTTLCAGVCVDTKADPSHCGDCGVACGPFQACDGGLCTRICQDDALTGCGDACVDITQSHSNCGACGTACSATELCIGATCQPAALYGVVGRGRTVGDLYTIDPTTGAGTSLHTMSFPYAGLAFDDDGLLYGIVPDFDDHGGELHQIHLGTGKVKLVGLGGYEPRGLTMLAGGRLLTCGLNDNHQYATLDLAEPFPIAANLPNGECDHRTSLATDASGTVFFAKASSMELGTLAADGTESLIATFASTTYRTGLAFHQGTLYAVEKVGGNLVSIDTTTAAVATIGPAPTDLKALASPTP